MVYGYVSKTLLPAHDIPSEASYLKLNYHDLLNVCEKVSVETTITDDMAKVVKLETRRQNKTKLWFKYRAGRVNASCMKADVKQM